MRPVINALVAQANETDKRQGIVTAHPSDPAKVEVRWAGNGSVTQPFAAQLTSAFAKGHEVYHYPEHEGGTSLGHGRILATRNHLGPTQHLVHFWHLAEARWVPWHSLAALRGVRATFLRGPKADAAETEALRLRNLAYALEEWNAGTGGLTRLEIDPLPHQLHVVHKILSSGDLNWLIADDVGLGKTIEVGLLLAALRQRGLKRVLLVVPAGLTRQWEEELRDKFFLDDFVVYGENVHPESASQWRMYDRMIVSVDRAKMERHRANFALAEPWDLVVFDEAHWLTRREYGFQMTKTDRYMVAEQLRRSADAFLLLSGTPHQGRDDQFRAILELLRPGHEWRRRFMKLGENPEILSQLVIRNRKADVTDIEGNFLFKGKTSNTISIRPSEDELAFDRALLEYFRMGYAVGRQLGDPGRVIGFVMTTYRKLASSSIAAIAHGLRRRHDRLVGPAQPDADTPEPTEADARFVEMDEFVSGSGTEFFQGELEVLDHLARMAEQLQNRDSKVTQFFDTVLPAILREDGQRKVLIFTEYRSTQDLIVDELARRFGRESVGRIKGGQPMQERREIVDRFSDSLQFLVSTEAGGEGLNLHHRCNVLVNFDLPWNPMRLVQRVGRLYRYGQTKRVVVFNVKVEDTLDQKILTGMYERLDAVARDMASVTGEDREGLIEDILGQLIGAIDVQDVLAEAATESEERSEERIEEAIRRAQDAARRQDELLRYASGFDPNELEGTLPLSVEHLKTFVEGMFDRTGIEVVARLYDGDVWELRLPEFFQHALGLRQNTRVAFDRTKARKANAKLMELDFPLLKELLLRAKDVRGDGKAGVVGLESGSCGLAGLMRWLDEAGRPVRTQYVCALLDGSGSIRINDPSWSEWLLRPVHEEPSPSPAGGHQFEDHYDTLRRRILEQSHRDASPGTYADDPYDIAAFVVEDAQTA